MSVRYELDAAGGFVCDIVDPDAPAERWTSDPVLQPANRPRYVGGEVDPETGEVSGGEWVDAEAPTQQELDEAEFAASVVRLTALIQRRLDEIAAERGYDSILSLCTYATSSVPKFQIEGQYGVELRDQCWTTGYAVLAEIAAGDRDWPTDEEALAMMPEMAWPNA